MTLERYAGRLSWSIKRPTLPGYVCHITDFDDKGVHDREVDVYATGRRFPPDDPDYIGSGITDPEQLVIVYDLEKEKKGENPWSCAWAKDTGVVQKLTLSEAEDLLKTWGVKRLNY